MLYSNNDFNYKMSDLLVIVWRSEIRGCSAAIYRPTSGIFKDNLPWLHAPTSPASVFWTETTKRQLFHPQIETPHM